MEISKSAIAAVAAVCVAGGVVIGIRQGSVATDAQQSPQLSQALPPADRTAGSGIQDSPPAAVPAEPVRSALAASAESTERVARAAAPAWTARPSAAPRSAPNPSRTSTPAADLPRTAESVPPTPTAAPEAVDARNTAAATGVTPEPQPVGDTPVEVVDEAISVPARSVVGLQLESSITSEKAEVEDEVIARITRDVRVGDRVAIPAGSRVQGFVTLVERGGRVRERARLGVRFTTIVLGNGTRLPIDTETVYREGESPVRENATKVGGGAIGGAIIGAILGGGKGAAIGSTLGAGAGSAAVIAGGRNAAVLNPNTPITVRLEQPVIVTVDHERR